MAFVGRACTWMRAWVTNKVTEAVTETLTETPLYAAGKRALPIVAAYVAASAMLLSHALLGGSQMGFMSYVLLTAAACVVLLALLVVACAPDVAAEVPLMATVAFVPLLAMQCVLAAFATCVHRENRGGFAVVSAVLVGWIVHALVVAAFEMKFSQVRGRERRRDGGARAAMRPCDSASDFDTVQESGGASEASSS